jgi:hypothetical protein
LERLNLHPFTVTDRHADAGILQGLTNDLLYSLTSRMWKQSGWRYNCGWRNNMTKQILNRKKSSSA